MKCLGNPRTFRAVSDGIRHHNPQLLFLLETKCTASARNLNKIKTAFNYSGCFIVDCIGRSGGLCLLWKDDIDVSIRSFTFYHIDAAIKWDSKSWRFTGIYGHPNAGYRDHTWKLLRRLHNQDESAWVIGGDFNATLLYEEKEGGVPVRESQIENFRSALDDCGLQDLDYLGDTFTWTNRQGESDQIIERLDKFIANEEYWQLFPNCSVTHLNWANSDHRPIMLQATSDLDSSDLGKHKRRIFRFEEVWATQPECRSLITRTGQWGSHHTGFPRLELCLKMCRQV